MSEGGISMLTVSMFFLHPFLRKKLTVQKSVSYIPIINLKIHSWHYLPPPPPYPSSLPPPFLPLPSSSKLTIAVQPSGLYRQAPGISGNHCSAVQTRVLLHCTVLQGDGGYCLVLYCSGMRCSATQNIVLRCSVVYNL